MQGSTLLCGMCALNNVFGDTIFEPELLNFIADLLWLEQASVDEIGTEFDKLRSESGSYNINVLISAAKHAGFSYVQKTAALLNFFKNAKLQSSELDSKKLLTSFMRTLGIASGQRILNNGSEHYVVLVFYGLGELRGLRGYRGRTKNPTNAKAAKFILTLGENEFCRLRGFQNEILSVEFVTRGKQQCT